MSVFTLARTDFTIGRELQYLKQNSNNSYFTKEREITGRQLDYVTSETEPHCSVSKCCFGACSAVFIPRKHPVKSVEILPVQLEWMYHDPPAQLPDQKLTHKHCANASYH